MKYLFKAATAYRIIDPAFIESLHLLKYQIVEECAPGQVSRTGWENPFNKAEEFAHERVISFGSTQYTILCMVTVQKVLKPAALRREVHKRVEAIEIAEGRGAGRKERMNIKDEVVFDALPNALSEEIRTFAYIDHDNNMLVVDQSSANKCDMFTSSLREALGGLRIEPMRSAKMPESVMQSWLVNNSQPPNVVLCGDAVFKNPSDLSQTARVKHVDIDGDSIKGIMGEGMSPQEISLQWNLTDTSFINFTVTDTVILKSISFSDELLFVDEEYEDAKQAYDASMLINCQTISDVIIGCFELFGGVHDE